MHIIYAKFMQNYMEKKYFEKVLHVHLKIREKRTSMLSTTIRSSVSRSRKTSIFVRFIPENLVRK